MVEKRNFKTFNKDYVNPSHPIAFSGLSKIQRYYNFKIPINKIKSALEAIDTYTTYYETKKPHVTNPYYVYKKGSNFKWI